MVSKAHIEMNKMLMTCLLAGALAGLLCIYQSCVIFNCSVSDMAADNYSMRRFTEFFIPFEMVLVFCVIAGKERLFRFRYLIAMLIFIVCVALEITGSSIGCFNGGAEKNLLLGVSRQIRSDEWAILTPMTWTQYMDPNGTFSYFNSVIRAEPTDVFLEYGLPISTPLMVFKPFLLGYLFLPIAKGMSFFWCGRLIALSMISFEFGRLITKDNRLLSIVYSAMIVFSPVVQWWFAINGFVEMLIFFQLSLICFDKYLKDDHTLRRLLYVAVIGICAGGYALTMYPPWMIPLAYVLLGCIVWVFYNNRTNGSIKRLRKKDVLSILFVLFVLLFSASYIINKSYETIETISNTVYPGQRIDNGGSVPISSLFGFIPSVWYAVRAKEGYMGVYGNVCECANFICLFPAGYLLYFHRLIKKKRDALCTIMVIISILLLIYCVLGIPATIASVSFLISSTAFRAAVVWGFVIVILLIRLIAMLSEDKDETVNRNYRRVRNRIPACLMMCGVVILGIWSSYQADVTFYNGYMIIIEAVLFIPLYCLLCDHSRNKIAVWAVFMISVCLISGALVNPVRRGVDDINMISEVQMIRSIVEKDHEAVWIVEGDTFPVPNLPLLAGAKTINCTNIYPDMERWRKVDPEGTYENCYNRYVASLQVIRQDRKSDNQKFVLHNNLAYTVYLSDEEIRSLGTKYILTNKDYSDDSMKLISSNGARNVYVIK